MASTGDPEKFEVIQLRDFTRGIHADRFGGSGVKGAIDGAATIENTYGCYADSSGTLCPLPARQVPQAWDFPVITDDFTVPLLPDIDESHWSPQYYPAEVTMWLGDAVILPNRYGYPVVVIGWNAHYQIEGDGSLGRNVVIVRQYAFEASVKPGGWVSSGDIFFGVSGTGISIDGVELDRTIALDDDDELTDINNYRSIVVVRGRHNLAGADGTSMASSPWKDLTTFDTVDNGNWPSHGLIHFWPNPMQDPGERELVTLKLGGYAFMPICAHQGRVVSASVGETSGIFLETVVHTALDYTPVGRIGDTSNFLNMIIGQDEPDQIQVLASLTADELFCVKTRGGGISIRGDLDRPQVIRLPHVESTGGAFARGIACPIGFVYGSVNGVFLYTGGEVTQKLSTQIEGWFWNNHHDTPAGFTFGVSQGRFGWFDPFVCVPNNYLYDTRTQSWWRLEEPGDGTAGSIMVYNHYHGVPGNRWGFEDGAKYSDQSLLAFHKQITPEWRCPFSIYTWDQLRSYYTWQSHPLVRTRDERLKFVEIELFAIGHEESESPQVRVTLTGYLENGEESEQIVTLFNLAPNGRIYFQRKDLNPALNNVRYVTCRIEALAASGPAPKIVGVDLYAIDAARSPKDPTVSSTPYDDDAPYDEDSTYD